MTRLIDADELLTDNTWEWFDEWGNCTAAGKAIMDAPTIDAEPVKHGEWVAAHIGETTSWYVECSKCHVVMPPVNYTYCPNCGAKMDKEIEDNGTE